MFLSPPRFTLMCDLMCMQNSTLIPPSNPSQSSRLCALCSCQRDWLYASQPYVSRVGFTESLSIHCLIVFWWRVHPIAALLWILCLDSLILTHCLPTLAVLPTPFFLHYWSSHQDSFITQCSIALSSILTSHFRHSCRDKGGGSDEEGSIRAEGVKEGNETAGL